MLLNKARAEAAAEAMIKWRAAQQGCLLFAIGYLAAVALIQGTPWRVTATVLLIDIAVFMLARSMRLKNRRFVEKYHNHVHHRKTG